MLKKVFKIIIQLYESFLLNNGLWTGRVVSTGSLKINDVIALAVLRRTDLNPATLYAGYTIMREVVLEQVLEGKYVEFGLSHYGLGVIGTFEGDHPEWDDEKNSLALRSLVANDVREEIKTVEKTVRGFANVGIAVNTLFDKESEEKNKRITPGGGVVLEGYRLKIAGDAEGVGLFLKNTGTGEVTQIPVKLIFDNEPGMLSFVVPVNLPEGEYQLSIVSQYMSGKRLLKEPRTYVFGHLLACGTDKKEAKN
jgi:hypothetical protein